MLKSCPYHYLIAKRTDLDVGAFIVGNTRVRLEETVRSCTALRARSAYGSKINANGAVVGFVRHLEVYVVMLMCEEKVKERLAIIKVAPSLTTEKILIRSFTCFPTSGNSTFPFCDPLRPHHDDAPSKRDFFLIRSDIVLDLALLS